MFSCERDLGKRNEVVLRAALRLVGNRWLDTWRKPVSPFTTEFLV
jgi:hypothetical protein